MTPDALTEPTRPAHISPSNQPRSEWDRFSWHAKKRAIASLDKIARALRDDVTALTEKREAARDELAKLHEEIASARTCLATRRDKPYDRVIWDDEEHWSDDELKAAHAAYGRGERDDWTKTGQRIYDRARRVTCTGCGGRKSTRHRVCPDCDASETLVARVEKSLEQQPPAAVAADLGRTVGGLESAMQRAGRPDLARAFAMERNRQRKHPCADCGASVNHRATRCPRCAAVKRAAA